MRPTLAQLCSRAGCSQATASRVLNGTTFVSPDVRERVLCATHELGYVPKRARRPQAIPALAGQPVVDIVFHRHTPVERLAFQDGRLTVAPPADVPRDALLAEDRRLSDAFYRHIIDGAVEELGRHGCKAALQANKDLRAPPFLAELNRPDQRGVLLVGEYSPDLDAFVRQFRQPLALVDLMCGSWPDVVTIDNRGGMQAVVQHLAELGHRHVGYVGGLSNPSLVERRNVFLWHAREAGLTVRPEWCCACSEQIAGAVASVQPMLRSSRRPTALVCCNDCAAFGVLRAAEACGLAVPRQLSVVGFDDVDPAALVTPALTTVHVPMIQMGRVGVRLLLTQEAAWPHPATGGCEARVRTHLVVRETTAQARRQRDGIKSRNGKNRKRGGAR